MKIKSKKRLKIFLIITLICLSITAVILSIVFFHKYKEYQTNQENIKLVSSIYTDENRDEIIVTDDVLGVPIDENITAIASLEIPSINFKNIVVDGTTQEALSKGVGLFEHSNILEGNVCVAGHNYNNFFAKLKDVKEGDIIKYYSCLGNKEYKITTIKQIDETDWSMLENTKDNRFTIITCVKGKRNLRLCVQATEII